MKEQLYTIPVNDAFDADCECPICALRKTLEDHAIEYTMGPSYMEDDNRAMTDEAGFCMHHIEMLYSEKNRLGLALMLKTHMDKTLADLRKLSKQKPASASLFKKATPTPMSSYIQKREESCFICNRIANTFDRYLDTIFHLWKKDPTFQNKFKSGKGFCIAHYGQLFDLAPSKLKEKELHQFYQDLDQVFFQNADRVNDDLEWFIQKFDYRFDKEPWKNSKDAIPRTIIKSNHIILD